MLQSSTYKDHLKGKHPGLNEGLMFSCPQCTFRTIKQDIFATHMSDHKLGLTVSRSIAALGNTAALEEGTMGGEGPSPLQELSPEMSLVDALQISIAQPSSLSLLSALTNQKILPSTTGVN